MKNKILALIHQKLGDVKLPGLCTVLGIQYEELKSVVYHGRNIYDANGRFKHSIVKLAQTLEVDPIDFMDELEKIRWKNKLLKQLEKKDVFGAEKYIFIKEDKLSAALLKFNYIYD